MNRIVVGIAGGSASGKSTVVHEVTRMLGVGRAAVLSHDAYYHDLSHLPMERRIEVNVDHPDSLETSLLVEHIVSLRSGQAVEMPVYDYVSQTRAASGIMVAPAPVILVEGLLTLHEARLRDLMDLRVFIDTTPEQRLARRIARDTLERGRNQETVEHQHAERVQPMHDVFVQPSRAHANVLLDGSGRNLEGIRALVDRVAALLEDRGA